MVSSGLGGPSTKWVITLADNENKDESDTFYLTKNTRASNKALLDYIPTQVELEQTSAERLQHCTSKARKRNFRR